MTVRKKSPNEGEQDAIDARLDQRHFVLNDEEFEALAPVSANPPPPSAALRALMKRKPPWE